MLPARPVANPLLHPPPGRGLRFPADVEDEPDDQEGKEGKSEGEEAEEEVGHLHQLVHHVRALLLHQPVHHVGALLLHLLHGRVGQVMCQVEIHNLRREEPNVNCESFWN